MAEGLLERLLERLNAATKPDQDLDADIWRGIIGFDPRIMLPTVWPDIGNPAPPSFPRVTASLDAALALVERTGFDTQLVILGAMASQEQPRLDLLPIAVVIQLLRGISDEAGATQSGTTQPDLLTDGAPLRQDETDDAVPGAGTATEGMDT